MSMPGDIEVINTVSIKNNGPAPIVRQNDVLGGLHSVDTLVDRDAIPSYLRQEGLVVYVVATASSFQLVGGITNTDWVAFGGATPPLSSVLLVGNTTGASDIEISSGQKVVSEALSPLVLDGSTTIDLQTGATTRWQLDAAGHLFPVADNTYDIGVSGTNRVRNIYAGTAVVVGATVTIDGTTNEITSSANLTIDTAAAGTLNLGDTNATTIVAGAGAGVTTLTAQADVVITGDLTVNGTTTTINTTNLTVSDALIYANDGGADPSFAGIAWGQGAALDIIVSWNPTNSRIELGRFDTVGGTTVPGGPLVTLTDVRVQNLTLAGTSIESDGALAVAATSAQLTLAATGANPVEIQTNGNSRLRAPSDGGLEFIGLAADPSVSAASNAKLIYNSSSNALRVSLNGAAYEDIPLASAITLQQAYDNGSTIATTTADGPVALSGTNANNDAVLTVTKNPAGAQSGNGVSVTMGANTTSPGLAMTTSGTGGGISVTVLGSGLAGFFSGGSVSCPVAGFANNERFGQGANSAAISASAFGNAANAQFSNSVAIGAVATTTATGGIAIGANSSATGVAIGSSASAAASGSVAIGTNSIVGAGFTGSIAIGVAVVPTAANQFVAGSGSASITSVYFGNGAENAAPADYTIFGTTATGANVNGGSVTVQAGSGNGTGFGGSLSLNGGTPGTTGAGGDLNLTAGPGGSVSGDGGDINLNAGSTTDGDGGSVSISAESGVGTARSGGSVSLTAGDSTDAIQGGSVDFSAGRGGDNGGAGGDLTIQSGDGGAVSGGAGSIFVQCGSPTDGNGGNLSLEASDGVGVDRDGGSVTIKAGQSTGAGTAGTIFLQTGESSTVERVRVEPAGNVAIGNPATSSATLHVNGSTAWRQQAIAVDTTLDGTVTVVLVDATVATRTITLPAAASCADRVYYIKKIDSSVNPVVIDGDAGETIDGAATQSLIAQYESLQIISTGTEWFIL